MTDVTSTVAAAPGGETEVSVEAQRKQKIANLKLKTACLENEETIQQLHVSDWSRTQRAALASAHEQAAQLLSGVESGTRWNLTPMYDFAKLQRTCGLDMPVDALYRPDDRPQFMDIVGLKKTLLELKQHRNKARVVSFTGMLDSALAKIERVEDELRKSQLNATDLAAVPVATLRAVEDIMGVTSIATALAQTEEQVKAAVAQIERTHEILNVAVADGEMVVVEEQLYTKVQLYERLLELLCDKFRMLDKIDAENAPFRKIYDVQKAATASSAAMKDAKRRLRQRCEADLKAIHEAVLKADVEDAEALKRFAGQRERSERYLAENVERQEECWAKIQDLEKHLTKLGIERFDEVRRRIDETDREERRKVEYQQFLDVVGSHRRLLELTVYNCEVAIRTTGLVEEMVAEAASAVKTRHDRTVQELADTRLEVHKEYLEYFRMLYLTLGNLVYKKEKRVEDIDRSIRTAHIQLEFCIETFDPNAKKHSDAKKALYLVRAQTEEELTMLKSKMVKALEDFKPTEEALAAAGIEYSHPIDEHGVEVVSRRAKMVEYRTHLAKSEEVKIAAEREEIKRAKTLRADAPTSPSRLITAGAAASRGGDAAPYDPAATV